MIYDFQGEKYNPNSRKINKIKLYRSQNNINSIDNKQNDNNYLKTKNKKSLDLFSKLGNQIMNPLLNSYQLRNINSKNNNLFSNYPIPKSYDNNYNNFVFGYPVEIHRSINCDEKSNNNYFRSLTNNNIIKEARIITNKFEKEEENCFTINSTGKKKDYIISSIIQETINDSSKNNKEEKNKKNEKKEEEIKALIAIEMKRKHEKWLKLLKYFLKIYSFFSILKKYSEKVKVIRNDKINQKENIILDEIYTIRNWMIDIQGKYWKNLINIKNINTTFTEFDTIDKIENNSKILIQLMDDYINNLKEKTNNLEEIPENVQIIIYNFIKKNSYFPKKYLSSFQINRLNFDFYGSCLNKSLKQSAMILTYLLISSISVQQIFFNIKFIFKKLKPYENISQTFRYIGSIIYYLSREAFINKIKINNNYFDLFNYYRCYQLTNDKIEKENNIEILLGINKNKDMSKIENDNINKDIYNQLLIKEKIINKFFEINNEAIKNFSDILFEWSMSLTKLILDKFEQK